MAGLLLNMRIFNFFLFKSSVSAAGLSTLNVFQSTHFIIFLHFIVF